MTKIFMVVCCLFCLNTLAQETDFIAGLTDVPKMAGLEEKNNDATLLDLPELRIVQVYVQGKNIKPQKFWDFYTQTLPQLGWHIQNDDEISKSWERDDEILSVEILKAKNETSNLIALFQISPKE
jgi:hypothetical protein